MASIFEAKLAHIETFDAVADVLILHIGYLFESCRKSHMYLALYTSLCQEICTVPICAGLLQFVRGQYPE